MPVPTDADAYRVYCTHPDCEFDEVYEDEGKPWADDAHRQARTAKTGHSSANPSHDVQLDVVE